ncbi:TonB family protein [Sphingobium sufflavum]|uniref:energy transducer TonB family protein n=1 Tax=Sphingobium sufflavum TaxID=1129547 RepID=UPI001F181964|nr:energy transducer TonB [Sphingobium sufflavum]MCE7796432.1 TonB family protein [Sphingobium sufflavum]
MVIVLASQWYRPTLRAGTDDTITLVRLAALPDRRANRVERGHDTGTPKAPHMTATIPYPVIELPRSAPGIEAVPVALPVPVAPSDGGRTDAPEQALLTYRRAVTARLAAERRYPGDALRRGHQGNGMILFRIDRTGSLLSAVVDKGTGSAELDREAVSLVRRAAPFHHIPAELPDELEIGLPILFLIAEPVSP